MADLLFEDPDLAALYDPVCPRDERGDYGFYLPRIMAARSVLDVGCGTGSLLHEAREAGHQGRLVGVDPAIGMIGEARRYSGIEWIHGDLTSPALEGPFDFVVMTGHAFQVLLEDAQILETLNAIRRLLAPGGLFGFETRNPSAREWEAWGREGALVIASPGGPPVTYVCKVETPFDGKTLSFTQTYSSAAWPAPRVSWSTLRFLGVAELNRLLAVAGLELVEQFGDWERGPVTDGSLEIVSIVRAAS
jgi:SAM-dependent methyltransferase